MLENWVSKSLPVMFCIVNGALITIVLPVVNSYIRTRKTREIIKLLSFPCFRENVRTKPEPKLVFRLATSFLFSFACFPHPFKCSSGFLSNSWCEREHGSPRFLQTLLILLPGSPFCAVSQLRLSEGFYTPTESPIWTFWLITCHSLTPWVFGSRV